jgi:hypothetical protein
MSLKRAEEITRTGALVWKCIRAAALLCIPVASAPAQSGCSGPWQTIGSNVSVTFTQVTRENWTWCLRNDALRRLVYLKFGYTDTKGDHEDLLPYGLDQGKAIGGWAAYMSSGRPSRMWIIEIKFKGDDEAKAAAKAARESLDEYRDLAQRALDQGNRFRSDATFNRVVSRARANVVRFEQRFGMSVSVDRAEAFYQDLQRDVAAAKTELEAALEAEPRSNAEASTPQSTRGGDRPRSTSPTGSSGGGGGTTAPQITAEDAEAVAEFIGMVFSGFDPDQGEGPYRGETRFRWSHEEMRNSLKTGTGTSPELKGQSAAIEYASLSWFGSPSASFRPAFEWGLGAEWRQWKAPSTGNLRWLTTIGGDFHSVFWMQFVGVGGIASYESGQAQVRQGTPQDFQGLLFGPMVTLASNRTPGFRPSIVAYSLSGTRTSGSGSATNSATVKRTGVIGELNLGVYFVRAELRSQKEIMPLVSKTFDQQLSLGGGLRMIR